MSFLRQSLGLENGEVDIDVNIGQPEDVFDNSTELEVVEESASIQREEAEVNDVVNDVTTLENYHSLITRRYNENYGLNSGDIDFVNLGLESLFSKYNVKTFEVIPSLESFYDSPKDYTKEVLDKLQISTEGLLSKLKEMVLNFFKKIYKFFTETLVKMFTKQKLGINKIKKRLKEVKDRTDGKMVEMTIEKSKMDQAPKTLVAILDFRQLEENKGEVILDKSYFDKLFSGLYGTYTALINWSKENSIPDTLDKIDFYTRIDKKIIRGVSTGKVKFNENSDSLIELKFKETSLSDITKSISLKDDKIKLYHTKTKKDVLTIVDFLEMVNNNCVNATKEIAKVEKTIKSIDDNDEKNKDKLKKLTPILSLMNDFTNYSKDAVDGTLVYLNEWVNSLEGKDIKEPKPEDKK